MEIKKVKKIIFNKKTKDYKIEFDDKEIKTISNLNLQINKFPQYKLNLEIDVKNDIEIKEEIKIQLENIGENINFIKENYKNEYYFLELNPKLEDKMIIGLGEHSVYETNITLHNIYGVPYIPGSALKGVLRNHIIKKYYINSDTKDSKEIEKNIIKDKFFNDLFGGEKNKGNLIFIDSFPNKNIEIKSDIMTPHHTKYFKNENDFPRDDEDPKIVKFLVVKGGNFKINIGIRNEYKELKIEIDEKNTGIKNNKEELDKKTYEEFIKNEIREALEFNGIGGKTSVGYGFFSFD
jgi:CRISPR-associated protein Cmr6